MYKKLKNQQGFTIIEVMIVLAIAGLILLIVFLAVPALQRSARNTQRKNDVSAISTAVNEFINNNNGNNPDTVAAGATTSTITFSNSVKTLNATATTNATLGHYKAASISINNKLAFKADPALTTDTVVVTNNSQCSGNKEVISTSGTQAYTVVYGVEGAGGSYTEACIQ